MKKAKIWIIFLCTLVAIVVTVVIFCCTLFAVKDIKLDFRTSLVYAYSESEIIEKSEIPYGKCVFFLKKSKYKENIEKNYPYLKVINIETKVPSHIVVHLAEREEFYAITYEDKTYICDDELKVLRIEEKSYESTENNAIKVDGNSLHINNETISIGDFLKIKEKGLLDLYNSFLKSDRKRSEMVSFIKEMNFFETYEQVTLTPEISLELVTHAGRKIFLYNIDYGQEYKLQKAFALLSNIMEIQKFSYNNVVYDRAEPINDNVKMTEILSGSEIHIYNYISRTEFSEKDNYYILRYQNIDIKSE